MDLSIVVVNWNTRHLLRRCLASAFEHARGVSFDVWVADNASTDGSAGLVAREFPQVRLLRNSRNLGYGAASNLALRVTSGRYVLVANADVEFVNDGIAAMARFLDTHPRVAALGPKLLNADGTLQPSCYRHIDGGVAFGIAWGVHTVIPYGLLARLDPDGPVRRAFTFPDHDKVLHPDWFRGAVMMLRREATSEVGGYDESFYMYGEEIDLFRRLKARGWEIAYLPEAEVIHHGEGSSSQAARAMAVEFWKSLFHITRKFPGDAPSAPVLWTAMMLGTSLRILATLAGLALGDRRSALHFRACGSIFKFGCGFDAAARAGVSAASAKAVNAGARPEA